MLEWKVDENGHIASQNMPSTFVFGQAIFFYHGKNFWLKEKEKMEHLYMPLRKWNDHDIPLGELTRVKKLVWE